MVAFAIVIGGVALLEMYAYYDALSRCEHVAEALFVSSYAGVIVYALASLLATVLK